MKLSQKEKQIPYANTYIWNLKKKMVLKNLGAGQDKDADIENGLEGTGGKGKLG